MNDKEFTHTSQPKTAYHYDFISLAIVKIK